jgi:hypothetical protein
VQTLGDGEYPIHGSAEAVEFPHDEGVSGVEVVERVDKTWTLGTTRLAMVWSDR